MSDRLDIADVFFADVFNHGPCGLGGMVEVGPTGANGLEARVLKLHAKDAARPIVCTISFDVKLLTALTTDPAHLPRVKLTWGSDQGGGEALVDLRHGLRVALEVTDLQADVIYHIIPDANLVGAATDGPDIRVFASVGIGTVSDQRLTLTEDSQTVAALANTTGITIPSYARALEVQSDQDPTIVAPNRFSVTILRGSFVGGRALAMYDERDMPITIPNGGEVAFIRNLGPGAAVYTPVFHLTL